jgi:hypothetical protein
MSQEVTPMHTDENVCKVKPGSYFTCDSTGYIEHINYWDLEYPDKVGLLITICSRRIFPDIRSMLSIHEVKKTLFWAYEDDC